MAGGEEIIRTIEEAFAGVTLGTGVSILEAEVIDDYGAEQERAAARAQDETEDWRKIPDATLINYGFSFMDEKGLQYCLPAYLCFAVRESQNQDPPEAPSFMIDELTTYPERFRLLTAAQVAAVRSTLAFLGEASEAWLQESTVRCGE